MRIHSGVSTEQPLHHLFFGHLQGEQRDRDSLFHCHVLRDIQGKAGLPHRGATGHDDQIGGLEPRGERVEASEPGRNPGYLCLPVVEPLDRLKGSFEDGPNWEEGTAHSVLGYLKDSAFRPIQDFVHLLLVREAFSNNLTASRDELAEQGFVPDDPGMVCHVCGSRDGLYQGDEIARPSHLFQLVPSAQLIPERDQVNGFVPVEQVLTGSENLLVSPAVKVLTAENLEGLHEGLVFYQNGSQNRDFRFWGLRWDLLGDRGRDAHLGPSRYSLTTSTWISATMPRYRWIGTAWVPKALIGPSSVIFLRSRSIPLAANASATSIFVTDPKRRSCSPAGRTMVRIRSRSRPAVDSASSFRRSSRCLACALSCSRDRRFEGVVSTASLCGIRKFRAYPPFTFTTSPTISTS